MKEIFQNFRFQRAQDGIICGYSEHHIIIGYDDDRGWTVKDNGDIIVKKFKSYQYLKS